MASARSGVARSGLSRSGDEDAATLALDGVVLCLAGTVAALTTGTQAGLYTPDRTYVLARDPRWFVVAPDNRSLLVAA